MVEGQISVLYRHEHFVTIIKRGKNIYQLLSDEGFSGTGFVWQRLGDEAFVDCEFNVPGGEDVETDVDNSEQRLLKGKNSVWNWT